MAPVHRGGGGGGNNLITQSAEFLASVFAQNSLPDQTLTLSGEGLVRYSATDCSGCRVYTRLHSTQTIWGEAPYDSRGVWNKPLHCKVPFLRKGVARETS